jgi:hypothetical protein
MANELFFHHFPDLAEAETRWLSLPAVTDGVPAGQYGFVESYCTDPTCDCRRVLLNVLRKDQGIVAVVSLGFDRNGPMPGPFLDPLNPQAPYAGNLLRLMCEIVLSDPAYVARLERHYRMVKEKLAKPGSPGKKPKKPKKWKRRR